MLLPYDAYVTVVALLLERCILTHCIGLTQKVSS